MTHLKYKDKPLCNIGGYVFIDKLVNLEKLKKAIEKTIFNMDCFSISIDTENDYSQTLGVFDQSDIYIEVIKDPHGKEVDLAKIAQEIINRPFDLEKPYYFKTCVWSGEKCSGFVFIGHHLVCDGWTFHLLAEAISTNYRDGLFDTNSYQEFIDCEDRYLSSEQAKKDEKYWNKFIADNMSETHKLLNISLSKNCTGWREVYSFTEEEMNKISQIEKQGISLNTILCAFFSIMSEKEFRTNIIGVPCFNRVGKKQKSIGGMFTSTMLSAANFDCDSTLMDNLKLYQKELLISFRHQKWPFEYIRFDRNSNPFMFSVNCYNTSMIYEYENSAKGYCHELHPDCQMFPAQIILNRWMNKWLLQFDFMEDYFNKGDSEKYIFYLREFIDGVIDKINLAEFDKRCNNKINMIQYQIEKIDGLSKISFYERISRIFSDEYSNRTLFIINDREILGKEFVEYITGAVEEFKNLGIETGDSVVVWMRNSLEYIVYVYACVATGIRFIPADISIPEERVCYLYENSNSKLVITDTEQNHGFKKCIKPVLKKSIKEFLPFKLSENNQLYMLYTSGSTGIPKGVMICRYSMATYLNWAEGYYGEGLCFYLHSSPSFDLSLTTLFLPLTSKGKIVIDENNTPLYGLGNLDLARNVNAIKATPTQLSLMINSNTDKLNLKVIISGGENLTLSLAENIQDIFGDACNIYNEYGPTECTIGCTCSKFEKLNKSNNDNVSIGIASPDTNVFVVNNENKRFCAPGESGEIYIAGNQVALGYWKLPKENDEHFLHNIFGCKNVYRTGDRARYSLNGKIEFLGRIESMIKINGYRIELDSIENTLKNIHDIKNAVVWVKKGSPDYLIAVVETLELSEDEIREILKCKLPSYEIPHYIYITERIPETINGKVNIEILKEQIYFEERNKKEENFRHLSFMSQDAAALVLEKVIREMFNYDGKMEDFDFIIQGGDSIQAIQLTARMKVEGYSISLMDILDNTRFNDMLNHIKGNKKYFEKKLYQLPANLKYFEETCDDFSKYYHEIHLLINKEITSEKVKILEEKLIEVFPGLCCLLKDGMISFEENSCHELFELKYVRENTLCIRIHHLLVDGVGWVEILNVIEKILHAQECSKYLLPEIWKFDETVSYKWNKTVWKADSKLKECSEYIEIDTHLEAIEFAEKIVNVMSKINSDFKYLLDCDSRFLLEIYQPNNIGCYSYLSPIYADSTISVAAQLEKTLNKKEIRIPDGKLIRISYLGNFDKIIPKTFILVEESLEISRLNCSAWGCEFEITAYIRNGILKLIIGTRLNKNFDSLKSICDSILDEFQKDIDEFALDYDFLDVF